MKRVLKSKRGVALESAILFMTLLSFLGILLTTIVSYTHLQVRVNETLIERRQQIEQVGENFLWLDTPDANDLDLPVGYSGEITQKTEGNENKVCFTLKKNNKVVLYIEKNENTNTAEVWRYSEK